MTAQTIAKPARRVARWKLEEVDELAKLIQDHPVIAIFKLVGLRANLLHEVRRILRDKAILRVAKKTLFCKAAEKAGKPELKRLLEDVKEPVGFIFSKIDAFKLKLILDKNRIPMHAKAGEKADMDVIIPEMNTGLPPGPILGDFGKLKIPTKIEGGQIWIARDTLVAKKGDVISPLLASLLARLDIKAVLKGVEIERAYVDGVILTREDLTIDLEKVKEDLQAAYTDAVKLATELGYTVRETIIPLLVKAEAQARALAIEAEIPARDVIVDIILRAENVAAALKQAIKES